MKKIETELCAFSPEAVAMAAAEGATRVELCSAPTEDGTTPSAAAIKRAREIPNIELSVMIRPRGGDFVYSSGEFETMKHDIAFARQLGADGVVFGLLTAEGDVDMARTKELVELSRPMEATFHKAFDATRNWEQALEDIIATGCVRILTSGQGRTAMEGIETLRKLVQKADGRIEIMAGGGVNPLNAGELANAGVDALHFSARASGAEASGKTPDPQNPQVDPEFIRKIVQL